MKTSTLGQKKGHEEYINSVEQNTLQGKAR